MTRLVASWLMVAVIGVSALLYGTIDEGPPRTDADRAYEIAKTLACPVCAGQSVAESDATVAKSIRRSIAVWIDEGQSDLFIRAAVVDRFGEEVDYTPSASGLTSLVWIIPVVGGAGALAGLFLIFRGWRDEEEFEASEADRALVETMRGELDADG